MSSRTCGSRWRFTAKTRWGLWARSRPRFAGRCGGSRRSGRSTGKSRSSAGASRSPWPGRRLPSQEPPEAARLHPADVRAERGLAKGRGQPAGRREAAGHGPEVAAGFQARRPRVSRQRSADQGLAAGDVPSAVNLLTRIIDALEAYLRVAPPSGLGLGAGATPAGSRHPLRSCLDRDHDH